MPIDRTQLDHDNTAGHLPEVFVTPHETDNGWLVIDSRAPNASYTDSTHGNKAEAETRARVLLEQHEDGGLLVLHRQDRTVQRSTRVDHRPEAT